MGFFAKAFPRQVRGIALLIAAFLVLGVAAILADFLLDGDMDGSASAGTGSGCGLAGLSAQDGSSADASSRIGDNGNGDVLADAFEGTYAEGVWDSLLRGDSLSEAMSNAGFVPLASQADAPQWLVGEVVELDDKEDVFASEDFSIVSFVQAGERDEVVGRLLSELSEKGWTPYGDSYADVISLTKQEGDCKWLMMECIDIDGEASVVLHIARD